MRFTKKNLNSTLWVKPQIMEKERQRFHVDANGKTLGRLAVEIAKKIQGKHKAHLCDFWDAGDFVVVNNVDKITTTGFKGNRKNYFTYSGYKGNVKSKTLAEMMQSKPEKVLWLAVRGMIPKNKLRKKRMKRLKLFVGDNHPYNHLELKPLLNE